MGVYCTVAHDGKDIYQILSLTFVPHPRFLSRVVFFVCLVEPYFPENALDVRDTSYYMWVNHVNLTTQYCSVTPSLKIHVEMTIKLTTTCEVNRSNMYIFITVLNLTERFRGVDDNALHY